MVLDFNKLSGLQLDALREIGNIGAGNAATALAQMVQKKIDMNVPEVSITPITQVPELVGGEDRHVVGIYLQVEGSVQANILFMLTLDEACLLVDLLMGRNPGETAFNTIGEIETSAIMEVGNILAATYLNALAAFTRLTLIPSVPALGIDMAGAVLDAVLAQFGQVADHVMVLETCFQKEGQDVVGQFFLLPEPEALDTLLNALGVSC